MLFRSSDFNFSADSGLSLDLNESAVEDLNFDNSGFENSVSSDLDLSADINDSPVFDEIENIAETPIITDNSDEEDDPFAAPESFNISTEEAEDLSVEFENSLAAPEPSSDLGSNDFTIEMTDDFNVETFDAGLEIENQTSLVETETFDFGDLDSNNALSEDLTASIEKPEATEDDFTSFEKDFDYGETEVSQPVVDEIITIDENENADFLDSLIDEPSIEDTVEETVEETVEDFTADDDLSNLIIGLDENLPKIADKPIDEIEEPEIDSENDYLINENTPEPEIQSAIEQNEDETSDDFGFDVNTLVDLDLNNAGLEANEPESFVSDAHGISMASPEILAEAPQLSPLEQLSEIRHILSESNDPDERYSLALEMQKLALPESKGDFIALLTDELKDIREVAATALGEIGAVEAVRPLVNCLTSEHPQLKFIAARSLGKISSEEAVIPLIKLLEEENEDLRYVTLEALGKIGSPTALKAASAFLKSRNNDLRFIACEAIGSIADPKSVSVVIPMLKDPEFEVRLKAIEALGKMASTQACDHLLVVLSEENERVRTATIQALGRIKNANAVEPLIDIYQVSNPQLKEKIIWALGEIGDGKAVEPLLKLANSFDSKQTTLALEAFSKIKSSKAGRYVLSILEKHDQALVLKAIEALGEIGEKTTAGNLIKFFDSPEPVQKIAAAKALGKIGNPIAIEALVKRLIDSERDVRLAAIEALGKIKGLAAIDPLIISLSEQDSQVIEKAEWAICEMGEIAVEALTKAIQNDSNKNILPSLVKILGRIGSIRSIFPLLKVLDSSKDKSLNACIADSLLSIDEYLTNSNPISVILKEGYAWAQFSIAKALADLNDERAFGLLIKISRDALTDKDIKKLAGIPDRRILECSSEILHLIRLNVTHLFAKVGNDKAVPVIMNYFAEGDQLQRQWCVEALGGIKTESALDALVDILKDRKSVV